jgi:hypothetical protein
MAVKNIFETMSPEQLDLYNEVTVNSRYVNPYFSLDPDTQFIIQDAKK